MFGLVSVMVESGVILVFGLALFLIGRKRKTKMVESAGAVAILIAIFLFLVNYLLWGP